MAEPLHQLEYANAAKRGAHALPRRRRGMFIQLLSAVLTTVAWAFIAIFAIGLIAGAVGGFVGPVFTGPGVMVAIVLIPLCAAARRMLRHRRGLTVLGYVRQAVRLNLPIPRVLLAAAASETGKTRDRLRDLHAALLTGAAVSTALSTAVPEVGERNLGLIVLAEQTGRLNDVLERIVNDEAKKSRAPSTGSGAMMYWYIPMVMLLAGAVILIISLFVVPRYERVMDGFHAPIPVSLTALEALSDWMPWLLLPLALMLLCACGLRLREAITGRPGIPIVRWLGDRLIWLVPLVRGMIADRALGDICLALGDSVEAGYALQHVLSRATQLDAPVVMTKRLSKWAAGIAQGRSPADAAKSAKMPALLVGLLRTTSASLVEVFRFVGRFYQMRFIHRREILRSLFLPVATALIGAVVLFVALSIFQPMQSLVLQAAGPFWYGP